MIGAVQYSAANAAVRARLAQLLSVADWRRLMDADSLQSIVAVLGNTRYGEAVTQETDRRELERGLRSHLSKGYRVAMPFVHGRARELLDWLWRRFELNNMAKVLRGLHGEVSPEAIGRALVPLGETSRLEWQAFTHAGSIQRLVDELRSQPKGHLFASALDSALQEYQRTRSVFVLEVSQSLAYHRRLRSLLRALRGRDAKEARRLIGISLDADLLLSALRYRVFFGLGVETILGYTLPARDSLDASVLRRAAAGDSIIPLFKEVLGEELPVTQELQEQSEADLLISLELLVRRHMVRLAEHALAGYPLHLGSILGYLVLLEEEVRDLIALIEAKEAGWQRDRIQAELAGKGASA